MTLSLTGAILLIGAGIVLGACSTATQTVRTDGITMNTETAGAGLEAPGVAIGGGLAIATISSEPTADQALFGPWTMARAGDRVCTVDLGSRNAVGDFTAKTRRCSSVELARIALWTPTPTGLVLYDFERRPVVTLRRTGDDLYEGTVSGDVRITLWR